MKPHIKSVLLSSCALLAAALGLGACTTEPDAHVSTVRYEAPRASPAVRDAQLRLIALGDYRGPADGLWGPATGEAVERFQRDRHLIVTARLDDATRDALEDATATRTVSLNDPGDIRAVQERLRQLGFYDGPVDGVWGVDTQAAIERFQRARGIYPGAVTVVSLNAMGIDPRNIYERQQVVVREEPAREPAVAGDPLEPRVVRGVQQRLRQLGFYRAAADGVWGPETQAALSKFQDSRGLEASGDLTPATAAMLGLNPNDLRSSVATYRR